MLSSKPSFHIPEFLQHLWRREISYIPTYYGRMVFLAGLRNPDTGRYEYYGCSERTSLSSVSQGLKGIHEEIFREWVALPLESKKADVEKYVNGLEISAADLIDAWIRLAPYKNLVPASVQGPEREKHISDIEVILGLLMNVYGVSLPDQDA